MIHSKTINKYLILGLVILSFIGIYILNSLYPLYDDDWGYVFVYNEFPIRKVSGLADILKSQYDHYFVWGGRTVVHIITQALLMFDPLLRYILKSFAYVGLIYAIYQICNFGKTAKPGLFLLINVVVWFSVPMFPQTVLQVTTSANYLWGTLLILSFLYFYVSYFLTEKKTNSVLRNILFFIYGIIVGWTNENTVFALISIIMGLIAYMIYKNIKIPQWCIWGLIGVCIGAIVMILAPGNAIRTEETIIYLKQADSSFSEILLYRIRNIYWLYKYQYQMVILNVLYIGMLALYYFCGSIKSKKKIIIISLLFYIGAHIATFVMLGSPIFPYRVAFGIVILFILAVGILYNNLVLEIKLLKYIRPIAYLAISVFLTLSYMKMYTAVSKFNNDFRIREEYIAEQKKIGNLEIVLNQPITAPWEFDFEDLSEEPTVWRNKNFANYYQIKSVRLEPEKPRK